MKYPLLFLFAILACSFHSSQNQQQKPAASLKVSPEPEKSRTLYFPEYGIYIHNWPKGYSLANHGLPCQEGNAESVFIIFTPSGSIGVLSISANQPLQKEETDSYHSLKRIDRSEFYGKVDIHLQTTGINQVDINLNGLELEYEQFFLQNLSAMPPVNDALVSEIKPGRFPLFVPNAEQSIGLMLDFTTKKKGTGLTSDFSLWIRNRRSGIGGICVIDSLIRGELTVSFTERLKQLQNGDSILVFNTDKSRKWSLAYKNNSITLTDLSKGVRKTKLRIPVTGGYRWEFICQKYENSIILQTGK